MRTVTEAFDGGLQQGGTARLIFKWIARKWRDEIWRRAVGRALVSIAVAALLGPAGGAELLFGVKDTLAIAAISGFASGAVATGDLKGAVQGAFTAALFAGVGDFIGKGGQGTGAFAGTAGAGIESVAGQIALHGVAGCVTGVASGGKCGPGALSAAFSKAATIGNVGGSSPEFGVVRSALIGGTVSELGGGKFANGAVTGAFGYLFNELAHQTTAAQRGHGRTEVYLEFKNIPGGDTLGATDPSLYPQHAYVIVRDTISGEEWISRAGPGGAGAGVGFGTVNAVTTLNTPGSTLDFGANVNARYLMFSADVAGAQLATQLVGYSNWVNSQGIPYNPLHMNSNTYAFHAIKVLTGNQPRPFVINGGAAKINAPASGN